MMRPVLRLVRLAACCIVPAVLGACSQGNSGDQPASSVSSIPTGIDRFLLFPNPIESSGSFETADNGYAQAYYRAIDPADGRDTLAKFRAANGFGTGGQEHTVVFRDVKDLGYGRRMTGRMNGDGTIAFLVENYDVSSVTGNYGALNTDAAVARDQRWHIGVNAIEYSASACDAAKDPAACDPTVKFAKFYNYSPTTGERQLAVDLDGKGMKAMPGPCISCHGGRADPLTPPDGASQPRFAFTPYSASKKRGDMDGKMQPFRVNTFEFSAVPGWTRAEEEAKLKDFNQWILCTYPRAGAAAGAEDTCRRAATSSEWQGTAAQMVKDWYGGNGMPGATFDDTYVPAGWSGNANLYRSVVVPYCRTCHLMRGTAAQDEIDLSTLAKFQGYADRIKTHVFDRGNMPLALLVYEDFWNDSTAVATLAAYIDTVLGAQSATDASGNPLRPGRPVADPGPSRMVASGFDATLSGTNSLFASTYAWAVTASPGGGDATLANASSATATFHATVAGNYTVRLTVGSAGQSDSRSIVVTVSSAFPDPASIRFATVKDILRNQIHSGSQTCVSCHVSSNSPPPPIFYGSIDRDQDAVTNATDDTWFHKELLGRINFTEITASPLLRKPSGQHHNGGTVLDLGTAAGLANYSKLYYWILNGAPVGGVAANAGAASSHTVNFTGSPASADIALDGSQSIGATSFSWSIVSGPGGASVVGANASTGTATLRVQNVGVYVVELSATDGTTTSTATRQITVNETAMSASFTPSSGSTATISFSGTPLTGSSTLTSTATGNPASCAWQVMSGTATLGSPTSCSSTSLTVSSAAIGSTIQVRLTVTGVDGTNVNAATNSITIASAGPNVTADAGSSGSVAVSFANPLGNALAGVPAGTVTLDGSGSSGPGTLTYSWSIVSQPTNATGTFAASVASASSQTTTLTVHRTGTYVVQLSVDNGLGPDVASRTITVGVPAGSTFTAVRTLLQDGAQCGSCHIWGSSPVPAVALGAGQPYWDSAVDTNGTSLYNRVLLRALVSDPSSANTTNPSGSRLLECPSLGCNAGSMAPQPGFHTGDFSNYNVFLNWIVGGAPNN